MCQYLTRPAIFPTLPDMWCMHGGGGGGGDGGGGGGGEGVGGDCVSIFFF